MRDDPGLDGIDEFQEPVAFLMPIFGSHDKLRCPGANMRKRFSNIAGSGAVSRAAPT